MFKGKLQLNKYIFVCDWLACSCLIVKAIDLLWTSFSLTVFMNDHSWWTILWTILSFISVRLICDFYIIDVIPCNYVLLHFLFLNIKFVVWSSLSRWSLAVRCSVLRLYIKRVRVCSFVFCWQIHALAGLTMNSKFSILHSATPRAVLKISRSLCGQRVRVFVNKTLTTVSNP